MQLGSSRVLVISRKPNLHVTVRLPSHLTLAGASGINEEICIFVIAMNEFSFLKGTNLSLRLIPSATLIIHVNFFSMISMRRNGGACWASGGSPTPSAVMRLPNNPLLDSSLRDWWSFLEMVFVGECEVFVCLGFVEIISFLYFFPWPRSS